MFDTMPVMDSKDRTHLEQILKLTEENNKLLAKLYRSLWWSRAWKIVYWAVIIGIAFGSFYFLKPYVDKVQALLGSVGKEVNVVQKVKGAVTGN